MRTSRAAHAHLRDHLARHRAGGDPGRRLAGRGSAAAAVIANAVFGIVDIVGVARPVFVFDLAVILRALVDIVDVDRDRRARRHLPPARLVEHHAGEEARLVGLAPLGCVFRGSRPPPVEIGLDLGEFERDHRRATVDDAADPGAVALAIGGHTKQASEGVVRHPSLSWLSLGRGAAGVKSEVQVPTRVFCSSPPFM